MSALPGMGPKADPAAVARVRGWATRALGLGPDGRVMVTELACSEPGCAPIETVIAISADGGTQQVKLHGAATSLSEAEVVASLHTAGVVTS